jgi:D-serine deaminase-like pyridoxal phosphate-dependent protein
MPIEQLKAAIANDFGTPALVVDLDRVERNIARVQALCDRAGMANRPHIKTHKSPRSPKCSWPPGPRASPVKSSAKPR